jgi:FACT complex subunit SPT16 N-terminal lobe domain
MAEDIIIDKGTFFNRLSGFYAAWKADKRSGNAVFGGAGSIVILMGKTDEANSFQKNNSMHVRQSPAFASLGIWAIDMLSTFSFGYLDMSFRLLSSFLPWKPCMWLLPRRKVKLTHVVSSFGFRFANISPCAVAKHLEPLRGGKIPVEILVTTKDPDQKAKVFEECLDVIKNSGVSF